MTDAIAIHGHDIIDLVATYRDGIRLSKLMEIVGERFGKSVTFRTGSAMGMDLDGLLRFLEDRDKVRITSCVGFPGGSPACEHVPDSVENRPVRKPDPLDCPVDESFRFKGF